MCLRQWKIVRNFYLFERSKYTSYMRGSIACLSPPSPTKNLLEDQKYTAVCGVTSLCLVSREDACMEHSTFRVTLNLGKIPSPITSDESHYLCLQSIADMPRTQVRSRISKSEFRPIVREYHDLVDIGSESMQCRTKRDFSTWGGGTVM